MALPLLLLLMAASAGANKMAANKVKHERSKALKEDRHRRDEQQRKSAVLAEETAKTLTETAATEKQRQAERAAMAERPAAPAPAPAPGGAPSSALATAAPTESASIISDAMGRAAEMNARIGGMRRAQEGLGDFTNIMVENAPTVTRNAQDVGENIARSRNWAEHVLPLQLDRANRSGRGWNTAADLLQLAAMIYGPTALGKVAAGGGGAAGMNAVNAAQGGTLGLGPQAGQFLQMNMGYPPL